MQLCSVRSGVRGFFLSASNCRMRRWRPRRSAFAVLGDVLRAKSFVGPLGAASLAAPATLGVAVYGHRTSYAAQCDDGRPRSALAVAGYSVVACHLLVRAGRTGARNAAVIRRLFIVPQGPCVSR